MSLLTKHIPSDDPDRLALADQQTTLGWADLDQMMNRAVNLVRSLDLGPERRLAVFAENSAETVIAYVAAALAGASAVPVNFHLTPDELTYILEDSASNLLLVGPETAERGVRAAEAVSNASGGPPIAVMGWHCPDRPGVISWEQGLALAPDEPPPTDIPPLPHLSSTPRAPLVGPRGWRPHLACTRAGRPSPSISPPAQLPTRLSAPIWWWARCITPGRLQPPATSWAGLQ